MRYLPIFKNRSTIKSIIMKSKFLIITVLCITSLLLFFNAGSVLAIDSGCSPIIKLVSQDPSPGVPNEYIKIVFEITNLGSCNGYSVKLNPQYPFSLDPNATTIQTIGTNPYAPGFRNVWTIPYKVRVDPAAFDGDYPLKLQYHEKSSENFDSYAEISFNVSIKDSRTSFDAVIQDTSSGEVSIAIANTGKYAANSVVVRIPEQNNFRVTGTDGQMVGNLASGDYTVVGFAVSPIRTMSGNSTRTNQQTPPYQTI